MQYVRRMDADANSDIDKAIAEATREGRPIDGSAIGAEAANRALSSYGFEQLLELIEAEAVTPALTDPADGFA